MPISTNSVVVHRFLRDELHFRLSYHTMMHCLHVLSTDADFQSRRGAQTLAGNCGPEFSSAIKTIGRGGTWRSVPFAVNELRQDGSNLVHAWDMPSLIAATFSHVERIIFSPPMLPANWSARWVRGIIERRDVMMVCHSSTIQRAWIRSGVPAESCQVIPPGVDPRRAKRLRNPELRAALGFTDADHVILAVGESSRAARHDRSVWATSILHVLDPNQKLLLWGRGPQFARAIRLASRLGSQALCAGAELKLGRPVDFEELLSAADMALITAEGPVAPLPIAICMASGLPIVATPSPTVREMLEDGRSASIVPTGAPRRIAQAIEDLRASVELQQSLAGRAASGASDRYSNAEFIARHAAIYAKRIDTLEPLSVAWASRPC